MSDDSSNERNRLIEKIVGVDSNLVRLLNSTSARTWLEVDITMPQLKILLLVADNDQVAMSRLAAALGVRLSTVTGTVDRLVEQGLVAREEAASDRRVVIVRLTPAGQDLVNRVYKAGRAGIAQLVHHLNIDDLQLVAQAMDIIHRATLEGATVEGVGVERPATERAAIERGTVEPAEMANHEGQEKGVHII